MGIRKPKPAGSAAPKRAATGALACALVPSPALAVIVGTAPLTRPAALTAFWRYVKAHDRQASEDRRIVIADDVLRPVIGDRCEMTRVPGKLSVHLSAAAA